MRWRVDELEPTAIGVSASRRTDIPALFAAWFRHRLEEGFAQYIPAGPPRRVRRSLLPADVTHFNFWTRWPRPFFRTLDRVLEIGYPVLFNVTVTGLGATVVEPLAPPTDRAVAALVELSRRIPTAAIQWRFDPLFVSQGFPPERLLERFRRLAGTLVSHVDRVCCSFVVPYGRRVRPDLDAYQREHRDAVVWLDLERQAELVDRLIALAESAGIRLTLCCAPELRARVTGEPAGCNAWGWAVRVYPELRRHRPLRARPTRDDCACSEECDIGVYDTCVLGCRYSYGSCDRATARRRFARHDSGAPCLVPEPPASPPAGLTVPDPS